MSRKFKFSRDGEGGYIATYLGWESLPPRVLGSVVRPQDLGISGNGWMCVAGNTATGPSKTRWDAAHRMLEHRLIQEALPLGESLKIRWAQASRRPGREIPEDLAGRLYDLLVERGGAYPGDKDGFVLHHTGKNGLPCSEWRFGGALGFGGKFYNAADRWTVSAYPEDMNAERRLLVAQLNIALADLFPGSKVSTAA